jgi:hypothetical protein
MDATFAVTRTLRRCLPKRVERLRKPSLQKDRSVHMNSIASLRRVLSGEDPMTTSEARGADREMTTPPTQYPPPFSCGQAAGTIAKPPQISLPPDILRACVTIGQENRLCISAVVISSAAWTLIRRGKHIVRRSISPKEHEIACCVFCQTSQYILD